jgi:2-amino-4-hydroxy-6-hydroxymethyldihydropteridine diphosphokinase
MCYAKTESVYLSLGSNLGNSRALIEEALGQIRALNQVTLCKISSFYLTAPVSDIPQPDFINAACLIETTLSPTALYTSLHRIETQLGKTPKPKNAPRLIDIDIIFFGTHFLKTPALCIPHPRWKERLFVILPLLDLIEEITYPLDDKGNCETLQLKKWKKTL